MEGRCVVCGDVVDVRGTGWYRQVMGWEQVRRKGGANKISQRETTGQVMHQACYRGSLVHPGQQEMFS